MPLELVTIPCLSDNYAFLLVNDQGEAALVDAPEAAPVNAELAKRGLTLTTVLLTHHHDDHIQGLAGLNTAPVQRVIGAAADAHRLPPLTEKVSEGDHITVLGEDVVIFDVSGHTVGHIAFHFPASGYVFTGDSLMAFGCGRLFEGTPGQMYQSLSKLAALPDDTLVCSGHEYTAANGRFAVTMAPNDPAVAARNAETDRLRSAGAFTVPSTLALEKATNPFLRAPDCASFTKLRIAKDRF
ncbi:hydroxyacylglutathione hydrolase [Lentibacter sp. XHP0401]|uniref:hydroxyacylglutathione hydrolase n=1 Tax=Lentibacter sp. XHP0401 TaxID=2984334 RepID=UPI0021E852B6|nr:hydroxyacylglutathione hydrolase [Lentibacter sp. XHP0401]MCV2894134.1 hydroxyacylglutathione hydrolase [Lentibacter sp. XHP0401]